MQSIENIGYGKVGKIFLEWSDPWWALGEGGIQLAWPESSIFSQSSLDLNCSPDLLNSPPKSNLSSSSGRPADKARSRVPYIDDWDGEIECLETHEMKNGIGTLFNGNSKLVNERFRHWYRGISNFSEVENQPNMLVCWIAGDSARIADQLDDDEVKHMCSISLPNCNILFHQQMHVT